MIHFGVKTSQLRFQGDFCELRKVWRQAEEDGFHSGWLSDHFFVVPRLGVTKQPWLEAWTTLSALAMHTKRLRLGVTCLSAAYRNPAILANMILTLDHICEGRLEVGVGSGSDAIEHTAYGMEYPSMKERTQRLREGVTILKRMLRGETVTFHGRYFTVEGAYCNLKPLQKPHPPIWIGGGNERHTLKVVAELADGWNLINATPEEYGGKIRQLEGYCKEIGRDIASIHKSWQGNIVISQRESEAHSQAAKHLPDKQALDRSIHGTPKMCIEQINRYVRIGVTYFMLTYPEMPADLQGLKLFADEVLPHFS